MYVLEEGHYTPGHYTAGQGCLESVEWNDGMEWWNGTLEWPKLCLKPLSQVISLKVGTTYLSS